MSKHVLVLGAGMVSGPCIGYLLKKQYAVTIVSASLDDLQRIAQLFPSSKTNLLDIQQEPNRLRDLVSKHDIVISLLPDHLHRLVTTLCIDYKKNFLHVMYEDDAIRELRNDAETAGITILSEVGLDPGIDHMLTMSCIDSIKQQGGEVTGYTSLCGGLPAPEHSDVPLKYKFSWYPKGTLMFITEASKYLKDGKIIEIPDGHSFDSPNIVDDLLEGFELESAPNGDSSPYREIYGIQSANTLYRGTLRYKGYGHEIQALISLGLFDINVLSQLLPGSARITWRELVSCLLKLPQNSSQKDIKHFVQDKFGHSEAQFDTLVKLGLLSDEEVPQVGTPLDALCSLLTKKLAYGPQEIDMVVMRIIIQSTLPNGDKQQHTYDLVERGHINGFSAMARTVGLTVAICTSLLLEGAVTRKGAILPTTSEIYKPVLEKLAEEGIQFKSSVTILK